jgi:hypothetical protein
LLAESPLQKPGGKAMRAAARFGRPLIGALGWVVLLAGAPALGQTVEQMGAANDKSKAAVEAGDFAAAAGHAQQALEIAEKALPANDSRLPVLAGNAGLLHERTENWPAAVAAYGRQIALLEKKEGEDSPALLDPLQKLAQAQSRNKEPGAAYDTAQRVLELIGERNGDESIEYANTSAGIAVLAIQDKHAKRADRHLRTALSIYKEQKGEQSVEVARTYLALAFVQFQEQQPSAAQDYLRKASKVYENVPDGHPDKVRFLEQRVQLAKSLGQPDDAKLLEELERNRAAAATFKPEPAPVGAQ